MPRIPPHTSPVRDDLVDIVQEDHKREAAQRAEDKGTYSPATRAAFAVFWWEEIIDKHATPIQTRSKYKNSGEELQGQPLLGIPALERELENQLTKSESIEEEQVDYLSNPSTTDELPFPESDPWTYPVESASDSNISEDEWDKKPRLLLSMNKDIMTKFIEGYQEDPYFQSRYANKIPNHAMVITPSHFRKGENGLLYFLDANYNAKLCVPRSQVNYVLKWIHDSPFESAHAGIKRFTLRLQELFFWKTLEKDSESYVRTCDVCQKIKTDHQKKIGALRPAHIPSRPFETVSMDLITGLPPSGEEGYTAVLVIVDKLTKFAIVIPTYNQLDQDGFAKLFVENVVNIFGMPQRIICDRDSRWATDFWKSVTRYYGSVLAMSSAHHPQTDGQTEILNALLEQMLRAYVAENRSSWSKWISVLTFAYNSSVHSSSTYSPNFLLLGYHPRLSTANIVQETDPSSRPFLPSQKAEDFLNSLEVNRNAAKRALVLAQEKQAKAFNKGRRLVPDIKVGDLVLVNPHTLKLVDVKGTGKKLVQRALGPFEVMEIINPMVYRLRLPKSYPMHPVFNIQHLKKYYPSPESLGERVKLPQTRPHFDEEPEYEVEAILGHRLTSKATGKRREYYIRWKGYGPESDEWISEDAIRNSPDLKREYLNLHKLN